MVFDLTCNYIYLRGWLRYMETDIFHESTLCDDLVLLMRKELIQEYTKMLRWGLTTHEQKVFELLIKHESSKI